MAEYNEVVSALPYFGNIEFYSNYIKGDMLIDVHEHYVKQSLRNRCELLDSQGAFSLSVPVNRPSGVKIKSKDIQVSYTEQWQHDHLQAIRSAYGSAPFFIHYWDEIVALFEHKDSLLIDWNIRVHNTICEMLGIESTLRFSEDYISSTSGLDIRSHFKKSSFQNPSYIQVFSDRMEFVHNRSVLDLIFCEGPSALDYLKSLTG